MRRSETLPEGKYSWSIEDYILQDVPAIIQYIRQQHKGTPQEGKKIHYVGHSMGAIIGFSLLATPTKQYLQSFVSIAGATFYEHSYWRFALCLVPCFSCCCSFVPLKPVLWVNGWTAYCFGCAANFAAYGCHIRNSVLARIQMKHFHSVPMELVKGLQQMTNSDGLQLELPAASGDVESGNVGTQNISIEGLGSSSSSSSSSISSSSRPYVAGTRDTWEAHIKASRPPGSLNDLPILALVGDKDIQCQEVDVLRTMQVTAPMCHNQKTVLLGAKGHGGKSFGHFDLILGIHTADIILPLLTDWFDKSLAQER
jgi:hypothetical protein